MQKVKRGGLILLAVIMSWSAGIPARAASGLAGSWNLALVQPGQEITLCLLKVEERDGRLQPAVVGGADIFEKASVEDVQGDERALRCTLKAGAETFRMTLLIPSSAEARTVKGSLVQGDQAEALLLSRTEATEFDPKKAFKASEGAEELAKATQSQDPKEQAGLLDEILKKQEGKPITLHVTQILLAANVQMGTAENKLQECVSRYLERAAEYGPAYEDFARLEAARLVLGSAKGKAIALALASQLEKSSAQADLGRQVSVLKVYSRALQRNGREAEAKEVEARLEAKESILDEKFQKKAVPFEPEAPAERTSKSDRVVLVELFTGVQCPPCVAADVAFDAVLKAYHATDVALLQYHLHVPGPDPLTNADSEARMELYGEAVQGTPTVLLNGKACRSVGGPAEEGKASYGTLRGAIEQARNKASEAKLSVQVKRDGDRLDLSAQVSDLRRTGDKVRLRFVLVEETVRYAGPNRQRLHHHVVRAFPGGVKGVVLEGSSASKAASISLSDLRKQLGEYLDKAAEQNPFPDEERPMKLAHLKVVAFIQDDASKEVLQAAQAEVPEN